MRLLFVVDSFSGGAGNVIQILAGSFRDRGYDVTVLLLNGIRVEPKYSMQGINVIDRALGNYASGKTPVDRIFKAVRLIRKEIAKVKPDIIISFLTELNILCCMANTGVPLIISERNDPGKEKLKKYWEILRNHYYKRANRIVVQCSNFIKFADGRFQNKVSVIPNPIIKPQRTKENADLHTPIRLVSLGRLNPQKNFAWMINRMADLREKNYVLSIFGAGGLEQELIKQINDLHLQDKVQLMGYTKDTYGVLTNQDIYLMTSDYEGFPNALSEAMAVGLPSVSRKCHDGLSDLVKDRINGIVVDPSDSAGFVSAINELVDNTEFRTSISEKAKMVSDIYSISAVTDMWEKEIADITNKG